jgi:hypothetical protein
VALVARGESLRLQGRLINVDKNATDGIRPGMQRVDVVRSDGRDVALTVDGTVTSAYRDPKTGMTVVVLVNRDTTAVPIRVRPAGASRWRSYVTSADPRDNLRFTGEQNARSVVVVPSRSLVTLVSTP